MSEELDDLVDNLREPSAWLRIAFMLAFALVLYLVIAPIVLVLMLAQAIFTIVTGDHNDNLRKFGAAFGLYIFQILQFLTFNSNEKPFPFSEFPGIALEEEIDDIAVAEPEIKQSTKKTTKKTSKKAAKKAAKKKASSKHEADKDEDKSESESA